MDSSYAYGLLKANSWNLILKSESRGGRTDCIMTLTDFAPKQCSSSSQHTHTFHQDLLDGNLQPSKSKHMVLMAIMVKIEGIFYTLLSYYSLNDCNLYNPIK